jgi:uncharacterized damage-inducible protein DinB
MTLFDDMLEAWRYTRDGVIAELENLPDARCHERPAGLLRSPLDLANHIIESGWLMAGELSRADGDFLRKPYPELVAELNPDAPAGTHAEALAVLRRSLEQGLALLRDAGEARMVQPIRQFNGVPALRLSWMHHGVAHEEYHRGQLALYARLFGLTPALTKLIEGETVSA